MDKKAIEQILTRAIQAKKEQIKKTELDLKKQHDDFLTLIRSSVDFNEQLKTQWTNKVFENSDEPVTGRFVFNIWWNEYGITENTQNIFANAISTYLYGLGFKNSEYGRAYEFYNINKKSKLFKQLDVRPDMYYNRLLSFKFIHLERTEFKTYYWYKRSIK